MLALSLSDKFCSFGIFVFNFFVFVFNRFLFFRFSFHHFFVLVLVFVDEFVIFSFLTVFVNENHTAADTDYWQNGRYRLWADYRCISVVNDRYLYNATFVIAAWLMSGVRGRSGASGFTVLRT